MAAKYSSGSDRDTSASVKDLQLCTKYAQNPASCNSKSCRCLHMCGEYFLGKKCEQLRSKGKCSHGHSFFTRHNLTVLRGEYSLPSNEEKLFEEVAKIIGISPGVVNQSTVMQGNGADMARATPKTKTSERLNPAMVGHHRHGPVLQKTESESLFTERSSSSTLSKSSAAPEKKSILPKRLLPSVHSMARPFSRSKSVGRGSHSQLTMATRSFDLESNEVVRLKPSASTLGSAKHASSMQQAQNHESSSDDSERDGAVGSSEKKSSAQSLFGNHRGNKRRYSNSSDLNGSQLNSAQMKYAFEQYKANDQLAFLHGPVRQCLIQNKAHTMFPSGYCRIADTKDENKLRRKIEELLPNPLKIAWIASKDNLLALVSCTAAGESLFETRADQLNYAVISQAENVSFQIEVISPSRNGGKRPMPNVSTNVLSSRASVGSSKSPPLSSDNPLLIPNTSSSISLLYGDITRAQADIMVCVTTSITLLNSVLAQTGQQVQADYRTRSGARSPFLLSGGATAARQILFVRWKLEIRSVDTAKAQKSLSDLVKNCIREADRLQANSITFPSVGTGKLGLEADRVCKVMIDAAAECLQQCTMNVVFVVYPAKENKENDRSYQTFRSYLDHLIGDGRPKRPLAASASLAPQSLSSVIDRSQSFQRTRPCKQIGIVSDAKDLATYADPLIRSLQKLIVRKSYTLSLVHQSFAIKPDSIIDVCLEHYVLPTIDFSKDNLTLHGDPDSCSQCFANLRRQGFVHKYHITVKTRMGSEETKMNMYVSLKIDEAIANDELSIRIEDDLDNTYQFDLRKSQVYVNHSTSASALYMREISGIDDRGASSKSDSTPRPMIRTMHVLQSEFHRIPCTRVFQATMSYPAWRIERVEAIDNWPLSVHYNRKKEKYDTIVFHSCSFSSVQSIIHYGLHSTSGSLRLTREAMSSHVRDSQRSTDGKYYMFAVILSKKISSKDSIVLSNEDAHYALPTHLITYLR